MNSVSRGILIATAAATMVVGGTIAVRATDKTGSEVHCAGINECKGKGSCAGAENGCKGKNACKGKGFVDLSSADECMKKGGKVIESKKGM
jgi:hypothetical protein